jgi:hypothetical protein
MVCIDQSTDTVLNLEISMIEDLPGDVRYALGSSQKPISPTAGTTVVNFDDDSVKQI